MDAPRDLSAIVSDMRTAAATLAEADAIEHAARSRQSAARDRVNDLQREFDAAIASLKQSAPEGSNWHGQQLRHAARAA